MQVHRRSFAVALPALLLGAAFGAAASAQTLPAQVPLAERGLHLLLWNAEVEIAVDPEAEPGLRLASLEPAGTNAQVRVEETAGTVRVERSPEMAGAGHRLHLTAVLHPGQPLQLQGIELAVEVVDRRFAPGAAAPAAAEAGPAAGGGGGEAAGSLSLAVERSQVLLLGVASPAFTGTDSALEMEGTTGATGLNLVGGLARVRSHRGGLQVTAQAKAEVKVLEQVGDVELSLEDAVLEIREGQGRCGGRAQHSTLLLSRWWGPVAVEATASTFEGRTLGGREANLQLGGRDLQVFLEGLVGRATLRLTGGTLRGEDLEGRLTLETWEGAETRLREVKGDAVLRLHSASTATVAGVEGGLRADLEAGKFSAEDVVRLDLSAAGSEITVAHVARLGKLDLTDCDLELDLTGVQAPPGIALRGESFGRVRMSAPCRVDVLGAAALDAGRLEVTGCALGVEERRRRLSAPTEGIRGDTVVLQVALDEEASLNVQGGP